MKRREFVTFIAGATAWLLPRTRAAHAQNPTPTNQAAAKEVGQVATLQGTATVTRGNAAAAVALQVKDLIFVNDTLATDVNSSLGVTFDDQTTFSLSANTRIVVNDYLYEEGGKANAASFNVAVGTASFVASLVARTGNMRITTPVATLGIRGTTGVVDVPPGHAAAGSGAAEPRIKLYQDADGYLGRIEVFNPQGERLGILTQSASAFLLQPGAGGRLAAVPFQIPAEEAARDRGLLQRLFVSQNIGRRLTSERLRSRRRNRSPGRQQRQHGGNSGSRRRR